MLYCEQQELCRLGQIKIQYEFCTVIMLLKISILSSWCKTKLKKGIRGWSKRTDNRRAFSAVIDVAVNYFGFDPINPEASFRQIDFNRIMSVLHNLGYFVCAPEVNKIIEILTSMKEIEELGACEKCKRPYIVPVTNDAHCPRCRLSSTASAIERYSQEELD